MSPPREKGELAVSRLEDMTMLARHTVKTLNRYTGKTVCRCTVLTMMVSLGGVGTAEATQIGCYEMAARVASVEGAAPDLVYAMIATESAGQPWALNVDGRAFYFRTKEAAAAAAKWHIPRAKNVDLGCMQISWKWHGHKFEDVAALLDVENNVRYGSRFLTSLNYRAGSWSEAVGLYHSGNGGKQVKYRCRIAAFLAARLGQKLTVCD